MGRKIVRRIFLRGLILKNFGGLSGLDHRNGWTTHNVNYLSAQTKRGTKGGGGEEERGNTRIVKSWVPDPLNPNLPTVQILVEEASHPRPGRPGFSLSQNDLQEINS